MNKHTAVIERMRDLTNKIMGAREYEIQDLLRESSDLLEQYGDALKRLGDKTLLINIPQPELTDYARRNQDYDARIQYARDTIEEGIE